MGINEQTVETVKMLVGNCITAGVTYMAAVQAGPVLLNYAMSVFGGVPIIPVPEAVYLLLIGTAYSVWLNGIVPFVDELYNSAKAKAGMKSTAAAQRKVATYFKII